jgi:hypothetical protein
MDQHRRIELVIHVADVPEEINVDRLDRGTLVDALSDHPRILGRGETGSVVLTLVRTHEWEMVIDIAMAGGTLFATAATQEIGKRVASWLAGQAKKAGGLFAERRSAPEVRASASGGSERVVVDVDNPDPAADRIAQLVEALARQNVRVGQVEYIRLELAAAPAPAS